MIRKRKKERKRKGVVVVCLCTLNMRTATMEVARPYIITLVNLETDVFVVFCLLLEIVSHTAVK